MALRCLTLVILETKTPGLCHQVGIDLYHALKEKIDQRECNGDAKYRPHRFTPAGPPLDHPYSQTSKKKKNEKIHDAMLPYGQLWLIRLLWNQIDDP